MKSNTFKHLCATILAVTATITTSAQIVYDNNRLSLTGAFNATSGWSNSNYKSINFKHFGGCYWTFKGNFDGFFQLDLSPRSPRLAGAFNCIVLYNTETSTYNSIEVASLYEHSDERAKTNVKSLGSSLGTLMSLRPVTFNWKQNNMTKAAAVAETAVETNRLNYGFLAQEVEEVVPEIVKDSDTGEKLVNYSALIPMLVEAVQELQKTVESQALIIEQLSNAQQYQSSQKTSQAKIINCTPNPTMGYVDIELDIQDTTGAEITITSLAGQREKSIKVDEKVVSTDTSALPSAYISFLSTPTINWPTHTA